MRRIIGVGLLLILPFTAAADHRLPVFEQMVPGSQARINQWRIQNKDKNESDLYELYARLLTVINEEELAPEEIQRTIIHAKKMESGGMHNWRSVKWAVAMQVIILNEKNKKLKAQQKDIEELQRRLSTLEDRLNLAPIK